MDSTIGANLVFSKGSVLYISLSDLMNNNKDELYKLLNIDTDRVEKALNRKLIAGACDRIKINTGAYLKLWLNTSKIDSKAYIISYVDREETKTLDVIKSKKDIDILILTYIDFNTDIKILDNSNIEILSNDGTSTDEMICNSNKEAILSILKNIHNISNCLRDDLFKVLENSRVLEVADIVDYNSISDKLRNKNFLLSEIVKSSKYKLIDIRIKSNLELPFKLKALTCDYSKEDIKSDFLALKLYGNISNYYDRRGINKVYDLLEQHIRDKDKERRYNELCSLIDTELSNISEKKKAILFLEDTVTGNIIRVNYIDDFIEKYKNIDINIIIPEEIILINNIGSLLSSINTLKIKNIGSIKLDIRYPSIYFIDEYVINLSRYLDDYPSKRIEIHANTILLVEDTQIDKLRIKPLTYVNKILTIYNKYKTNKFNYAGNEVYKKVVYKDT